ncbi:hypothetical protein ACOSP6_13505 [Tenacibaculum sp. MEBiC06402]|uniref:hypothetical protein n=1 Tax=unclassified Tenacibaculum TaxID=2635139 RepID=UPI003B9CBDE7
MTPHYAKTKLPLYLLSLLVVTTLFSCATTQSVAGSDDGIYADDNETQQRKVVVQDTNRDYKNYNENYFTKELERLDGLNGTDILTDIESYQSEDYEFEDETIDEDPDTQINYNSENAPWGYDSDSDVVINVNTFPRYRLGWNFNTYWGDPFWDGPFGWNRWGWNWGYDPYWYPYNNVGWGWGWNNWRWNNWGWNNGLYCPPNGYYGLAYRNRRGFYNNRYNRGGIYSRNTLASNRRTHYRNSTRALSRRSSNIYRRNNSQISRNRRNNSVRNSNGTRINRKTKIRRYRTGGVRPSRGNTGGYRPNRSGGSNNRTGGYKPSRTRRNSASTGGYKPSRTKSSKSNSKRRYANKSNNSNSRYSNRSSSSRNSSYSSSRSSRSSSRSYSSGSSRSSRSFSSGRSSSRGSSRRR